MASTSTNPDATYYFEQLVIVAKRLLEEGKSTRSAGIKPILREMSRLDENRLGFMTFRGFLEAAQAAGHVQLRPSVNVPDVEVFPPDWVAPAPAPQRQRIRNDLWDAFVDWTPGFIRVYDRERDRAFRFSEVEVSGEPESLKATRRNWRANPDGYVEISPIAIDETLALMREFAFAQVDEPTKDRLLTSLAGVRPVRQFTMTVKALNLYSDWDAIRLAQIEKTMNDWAESHGLEIDLYRSSEPEATSSPRRAPGVKETISTEDLRRIVQTAVEGMTRAELLRVPIPLEAVVDRLIK